MTERHRDAAAADAGAPGRAAPAEKAGRRARRRRAPPAPPCRLHEQAAAALVEAAGEDVAFVLGPDVLWWAAGPGGDAWSAESAVSRLVQGLYDLHGTRAARLLRRPVWSTRDVDPFGLGLVKVHAKRLYRVTPRDHGLAPPPAREVRWAFAPPPAPEVPAHPRPGDVAGWAEVARRLAARAPASDAGPRWASDRRVAALLLAPDGALLGAALNTHGRNRTLHAEVNLALGHAAATGAPLPPGATVVVSLRPCKACAGLLWAAAADPARLRVVYAQDDPGPAARNTVLCLGSDPRRRFARTTAELQAPCLVPAPAPGAPG
ncbi:MAG: Bd3614 family nucleic acid deaminase [Planctomycetes bacterium]|nr:Bd3614 family nucleic acid deaminase [Planctomycetota bacterium]